MILDKWQEEILKTKGNIAVVAPRQVGKSTIIAKLASDFIKNNYNKSVIIGAAVERQELLIFLKILNQIDKKFIVGRSTLNFVKLTNGCTINCVPIGDTGLGVRGFTADMVIIDEAAFVRPVAWEAIFPLTANTGGPLILLSTPHGREGFFYDCFEDPKFTKFHIKIDDVLKSPTRTKENIKFIKENRELAKRRMTKVQFATEYEGEFIDEFLQYFPGDLVEELCSLKEEQHVSSKYRYAMGIDIAGPGKDDTTLEIFNITDKKRVIHVKNIIRKEIHHKDLMEEIRALKKEYHMGSKSIGMDSAGIGSGLFQFMMKDNELKRCIIPLDNATRPIDSDDGTRKLLKELMYTSLKLKMEKEEILFLDDPDIKRSFKSIQCLDTERKELQFKGNYSHIIEGIVRAIWCAETIGLRPFIA